MSMLEDCWRVVTATCEFMGATCECVSVRHTVRLSRDLGRWLLTVCVPDYMLSESSPCLFCPLLPTAPVVYGGGGGGLDG